MGIKNIIRKFLFNNKRRAEQEDGQLFFIGNKRSGTTILAEKIGMHPDIYITHETDIIWILYNLYNGIEFSYYPMDEPHSTAVTLKLCESILGDYQNLTPQECFRKCQTHLMRQGTQWRKPTQKTVRVLGDKKPNQQSEVHVADWVSQHFPRTKYVHIVRHPFDFLNSIPRLLPKYDLGARYGSPKCKDPVTILEAWAYFEDLVIQHRKKGGFSIYSLRFEDFCERPAQELEHIWKFAGVSIPEDLQARINENDNFGILHKGLHNNSRGNHYNGHIPECARKIMEVYQYTLDGGTER